MAEINIRLIYNLETGKKDIYIDFESDSDALPIEHEEAHRGIVEQLIGQKVLTEQEAGEVVVRRVEPEPRVQQDTEETTGPEQQGVSS